MDWAQTEFEIEETLLPTVVEQYLAYRRVLAQYRRLVPELKAFDAAADECADAVAGLVAALEGVEADG